MQTTLVTVLLMTVTVSMSNGHPPGVFHALHAPYSSDTKVVRDGLGNQATSYAYQDHGDGHSSAVALSRTDVDRHLVAVAEPVVAYNHAPPVVAYDAGPYHHGAHGVYAHGVGPVGPAVYHQTPAVYHQAPAGYHHGPGGVYNHGYGAGFGPAYYNHI